MIASCLGQNLFSNASVKDLLSVLKTEMGTGSLSRIGQSSTSKVKLAILIAYSCAIATQERPWHKI